MLIESLCKPFSVQEQRPPEGRQAAATETSPAELLPGRAAPLLNHPSGASSAPQQPQRQSVACAAELWG